MQKVAIGADHRGFFLKQKIITGLPFEFIDCGTNSDARCDYTKVVRSVVDQMQKGAAKFGVLLCGSGIGVSVMANRFHNIRAALCFDRQIAINSRQHSDANVACFGVDYFNESDIFDWIIAFMETKFLEEEPYLTRVKTLGKYGS